MGWPAGPCLWIGTNLDSPVPLDYFDQVPLACNGKIETVHEQYTK